MVRAVARRVRYRRVWVGGAWGERSDDEREAVEREAVPVTDVGEAFGVDELCAAGVADYCWGTHATRG